MRRGGGGYSISLPPGSKRHNVEAVHAVYPNNSKLVISTNYTNLQAFKLAHPIAYEVQLYQDNTKSP